MHLINAISVRKEDKMQMKKHKTSTQITTAVSSNLNFGVWSKCESAKFEISFEGCYRQCLLWVVIILLLS